MERPFGTMCSRQTHGYDVAGLGEAAHRQPCTGLQGVGGEPGVSTPGAPTDTMSVFFLAQILQNHGRVLKKIKSKK